MSGWMLPLLVAIGGAAGSVTRYGVGLAAGRLLGPGFPFGTLTVNVVGSLLMGVAFGLVTSRLTLAAEWKALAMTGFLGGFTTFSAFSLDVVQLADRGDWLAATGYLTASVILSIAALLLGLWLVRL